MKHLRPGLLDQAITSLSDSQVLKLISKMTISPDEKRQLFESAWENQKWEVMENLALDYAILGDFQFMRELYLEFVSQKQFDRLPLPAFSTDRESFATLVEKLMQKDFKRGYLKRFGQLTEAHGSVFINNMYYLVTIYPADERRFDEFLNLDHSKAILKRVAVQTQGKLTAIRQHYSIRRMYRLLLDANPNHIIDTEMMLSQADVGQILPGLPRKPRSFLEIHDAVSFLTLKTKKAYRVLNQEIAYLHGMVLLDHTIEVPKDTEDLIGTSSELHHCVHGYDQAVIRRECQILNLIKDGKRCYTIELVPKGDTYVINQFKGTRNNPLMEGPAGMPYQAALRKLLKPRGATEE